MARYGKIETGFWHSPKIKRLSQEAKYLMLYLLSCPHGNALGCFVLHEGYISTDLGWVSEVVTRCLKELADKGLIERDEETALTRLLGWWGHNSIENPNVAKHVVKEIGALPACVVKDNLIEAVTKVQGLLPTVARILAEQLGKPFREGFQTVDQPTPEPFPNQEPIKTHLNTSNSRLLAKASSPAVADESLKTRGTRLTADWRLCDKDREFASSMGFTRLDIDKIHASFVDFWIAKAGPDGVKRDWPATWRNWVRREAERTNRKPTFKAESHSIDWDKAVADHRASNGSRWASKIYGPEPGYAGCRAPSSVLAKHGYGVGV